MRMPSGATSVGVPAIAIVLGVLSIGCAAPDEDNLALSKYQEVQAAYVGTSGTTAPVLINRNWGSIEQATGAIRPWNKYWSNPDGERSSGNCGATFVTATHAITAAHCVDATMIGGGIQIEHINASGMTDAKFRAQDDVTIQSGYTDWPFYWRANELVASDGYVINNGNGKMACTVKRRCGTEWGPEISCPAGNSGVDIAVLECPNRPSIMGSSAVSVTLAASDDGNTSNDDDNIEIFWFHEVVDLYAGTAGGSTTPAGNNDHYRFYDGTVEENYHYFNFHGRHQLIPVRSRWRDGTRYESLGQDLSWTTKTNVPICHGTSGSGAFRKQASDGAIRFVGPMVHGFRESSSGVISSMGSVLCHDMGSTQSRSSYVKLAYTARMAAGL